MSAARGGRLETTARKAVRRLAEIEVCCHGPGFDSHEWPDFDSTCDVCLALRPLVLALEPAP